MRIILVLLLSLASTALGAELQCWVTPPTTNADGTPLTDLAGITIRLESGQTGTIFTSDIHTDVTYTWNLPEGTYCGVAYAFDTSGNVSGPSNRVCKTISTSPAQPVQCNAPAAPPISAVVSFSTTSVGRTSYGDIRWMNTGPQIVSVASITFTTTQFNKTTTIPMVLDPGAIGRIGLKFQPRSVGVINGEAEIILSTGDRVRFRLRGSGK